MQLSLSLYPSRHSAVPPLSIAKSPIEPESRLGELENRDFPTSGQITGIRKLFPAAPVGLFAIPTHATAQKRRKFFEHGNGPPGWRWS